MALQTFRSNPSLGGFGSENTANVFRRRPVITPPPTTTTAEPAILERENESSVDPDAFAQILKELVDNAVDACGNCLHNPGEAPAAVRGTAKRKAKPASKGSKAVSVQEEQKPKKRVQVRIEKVHKHHADPENNSQANPSSMPADVLRVVVTDNGCGIPDIQAAVDTFQTSKAHNANKMPRDSDARSTSSQLQTAGRYGLGLTLSLLHAQRLVPGSSASIQSATIHDTDYRSVLCVVDSEHDSIRCVRHRLRPKTNSNDSGTAVSLLLPART
jgi:Histidine kinase-, DNA gyrase B-, and HSP90-like ATPase